jgi:methionyl-tRNA synthetase
VPGTFYITTPIYYVNDMPHIGHIYTTVMADVLARYRRMRGARVHFLTGTDEHGQKIARAARDQGIEPIQLADRVVERYNHLWNVLEISNDDFIRTTEPRHEKAVSEIIRRINERGDIYKGSYEGWYSSGGGLRTRLAGRRRPRHHDRLRGRAVGGAELLLPAVGVAGPAARTPRQSLR